MEREFCEESFPLKMALQGVQMTTRVLGFFRWMRRGGKPEFVGVTKAEVTFSHLEANLDEVNHPDLNTISCQSIDQMLEVIDHFTNPKTAEENTNHFDLSVSVPLWVNLNCLGDALHESPQYWAKFFEIDYHNEGVHDDVEDPLYGRT